MAVFETVIPVRFQHCDPAGIVFYPRYLEMINQTVEEWFAAMGRAFPDMVLTYMDLDCRRPVRLPEDLKARMTDYGVPVAAQ